MPKRKLRSSKQEEVAEEAKGVIGKDKENGKKEKETNKIVGPYWLMKSEPESRIENGHEMKFSFDDLKAREDQITHWDGVRNYEARNLMKAMQVGQYAFFYHSNCKNPGIIGIVKICKEAYVDHTAFDTNDPHYDPKSDKKNPKWFMVDVKFERDLKRFIPLTELKYYHLLHKANGKGPLRNISLFTRSRLSVQSLNEEEWNFIVNLEHEKCVA
jgi:predicted RNA-binding protein with PUA-like domain